MIDPVLVYSTFVGGNGDDAPSLDAFVSNAAIAVNSQRNMYVIGFTDSPNFPVGPVTFDPTCGTVAQTCAATFTIDGVVTKISAACNARVYSTYLGGVGNDDGRSIAVDSSFQVYVTGATSSVNFPTATPEQNAIGGQQDA